MDGQMVLPGYEREQKGCCFTGHRQIENIPVLQDMIHTAVLRLAETGVTDFYCGMAMGFDLLCAKQVIIIRQMHPGIRLICVLPCRDQTKYWKPGVRSAYTVITEMADEVVFTSEDYFQGCMQLRNRYLVDHSSDCIAFYNGFPSGGTHYTVKYARKKGLRIINLLETE